MAKATVYSRAKDCGLAAAPGIILGVYMGVAVCFAAGFYWLMQPTVSRNPGLAAYKALPKTVVVYADSAWVPHTPPQSPATVGIAETAPEVVESTVAAPKNDTVVVAPKKTTKRREARTTPRRREPLARERTNPFWDYAASTSYGYRPWF
jgi:hypothetical protein